MEMLIRLKDPMHAKAFLTDQANRPDQPLEELPAARFGPVIRMQAPCTIVPHHAQHLPIALRHTLQLVLLLDGVRVAASLGSVDELFSQALGNALDVAERSLAGTDGEERDGLVDAAERGHIDGLATDGTCGADTGGVFAGSAVDDGVNGNLDRVLVRHDVDLIWSAKSNALSPRMLATLPPCAGNYICRTYDLERVGNDSDSHELLAVVAAVHHERVGEALNDGALGLPESLDGITAGRV